MVPALDTGVELVARAVTAELLVFDVSGVVIGITLRGATLGVVTLFVEPPVLPDPPTGTKVPSDFKTNCSVVEPAAPVGCA